MFSSLLSINSRPGSIAAMKGDHNTDQIRVSAMLPVTVPLQPPSDTESLSKAIRLFEQQRQDRESAFRFPSFVRPVNGIITSNFGPRWGSTHYGLDIANAIGTPVRSVGDGVVIDAGPAHGFGLWVRIRLADGSVTVYGHINRYLVKEGQQVKAGQVIAEVGDRGVSTGPHLHFEILDPTGRRLDPLAWLRKRGAGY
ncbi:hypothetical protein PSD17_38060 [Pseudonocardia sp. D17]|nr:hypothetical protein PSD17_38060 [Pseudonocardia sp. D17]